VLRLPAIEQREVGVAPGLALLANGLASRQVLLASAPLKYDPIYAEGYRADRRLRELGDASAVAVHYPANMSQ